MAVLSKLLKTAAKKGKDVVDEIPVEKEIIPVAPVNQANLEKLGLDYKPGGEYVNPKTKEILTNKNVGGANIKVRPDMEIKGGRPQATMSVTDLDMPTIGSKGTDIKVNLVKPTKTGKKAGWNWTSRVDENMDANTLVSVTNKGKHYYTLETDFSRGANLRTYPNNKDEPRLRPTVSGNLELGNPVGTISLRGKEHPVYDKITTYNEGGAVMKKQMEMFQEGGLEQDGGTVDPVSGNEVPVGSSQEEVRDDIDAKLSEGEFVFPADVVRYIGLEKLMMLRQEAKAGLKKMEAMGQMGNSEEATIPDDIPFSPEDITVEDDDGNEGDLEMNVGGVVYQPSQVGSQFNIAPQQQDPSGTMGYSYVPPVQQTGYGPSFMGQPQTQQQYTGFQNLLPAAQSFDSVEYINNTTGETMTIPHVDGKPIYPPPAGFTVKPKEEVKPEEPKTEEVTIPTTQVAEAKESDDRNENENRLQSTKSLLGATSTLGAGTGLKGIASNKFAQAGLALLTGGIAPAVLALTGIPQKIANTIIGKAKSGEELTEEEQLQADALSNAVADQLGENVDPANNVARNNLMQNLGGMFVSGKVGLEVGDIDPVTGGIFNQAGQAVDPRTNENLSSYRSFKDAKVSMKAGAKAGWFGGEISNSTYMGLGEEGKKRYGNYVKNMAEEGVNIAAEGRGGSGTGDTGTFKIATKRTPEGFSKIVTDKSKIVDANKAKAEAKAKADALFAQQEAAAKKYLQQLENQRAEAEENRKKAREEAIAAKAEQRDRAIRESEDRFVQEAGMRRAKGGIASKPKKKTMKRGGLASK